MASVRETLIGRAAQRPSVPAPVEDPPAASLTWFAPLWALATLFHLAGNGQHLAVLDAIGLAQLGMAALAALILAVPGWRRVGALAVLSLLVLWLKLPVVGNHEIILGLVNAAIVVAVARRRERWVEEAAPAARLVLLVAYGYIALSKWNADFLDPAVSCAVVFADDLGRWLGLAVAGRPPLEHGAIAVTVLVETAIPILLVVPRLRRFGVALALAFHTVLALDPASHVWDFTSVLVPLFLLFAPGQVQTRLAEVWATIAADPPDRRVLVVAIGAAAHGVVLVGAHPPWLVAFPLFVAVVGVVLGATMPGLMAGRNGGALGFRVGPAMVPVVALAVLNGVAPYAGWRSAAAFNMYANLQVTEGASNHLFVPTVRPAAGDGPDPAGRAIEIVAAPVDSPLRYYVERGLAVPPENLHRYHVRYPDHEAIVAVDGGQRQPIGTALAELEGPPSGMLGVLHRKLAFRRAVDPVPPVGCLRTWGPAG